MAKKKKVHHRKPRRAAPAKKRRPRRRAMGLSAMLNPTMLHNGIKTSMGAVAGATGAVFVNKTLPPTTGKLWRAAIAVGVGMLASSAGYSNVGSGFTGGLMALSFQNGLMGDEGDNNFADPDSLSGMPLFLDDQGNPMVLEEGEDGNAGYRYLSEEELNELERDGAFDEHEELDEDY